MLEMFRLGGFGMIPTFLFGVLAVATSIRYARSPDPRSMSLMIALGSLTLASGALGFVMGMIKSLSAVQEVGPDMRWIWLIGTAESLHNIALALALIAMMALAASVGALRSSRLPVPG